MRSHQVCLVDPAVDTRWKNLRSHIKTDGVHEKDRLSNESHSPGEVISCQSVLYRTYMFTLAIYTYMHLTVHFPHADVH